VENRFYTRITVNVPSAIYITFKDHTRMELNGVIRDISEGGVQIRIDMSDYANLVGRLTNGDNIRFQAVDEYQMLSDTKEDIIEGTGEVVWISTTENEIAFGCKAKKVLPEYLTYIKNKKLSLFFSGNHDIGLVGMTS